MDWRLSGSKIDFEFGIAASYQIDIEKPDVGFARRRVFCWNGPSHQESAKIPEEMVYVAVIRSVTIAGKLLPAIKRISTARAI
jgi:hypothetical protein